MTREPPPSVMRRLRERLGPDAAGLALVRALQDPATLIGMARTLDMEVEAVEEGRVTLLSHPCPHLENTNGVAQGGYAASLLDMACGYAIITRLPAGKTCTTLELKVAYHRPVRLDGGPVRATGVVVSAGRRAAFAEARLTDAAGKLLSSASSTFMVTDF